MTMASVIKIKFGAGNAFSECTNFGADYAQGLIRRAFWREDDCWK
jgi:hypothetical protein